MDKPRICEVLGVEAMERITYKDRTYEETFFFTEDGQPMFYNREINDADIGHILVEAINHPDRIIRKPKQEQGEKKVDKLLKDWTLGEVEKLCHDLGKDCDGCPFYVDYCKVNGQPRDWDLSEKPHWTEQEVELAKAAKKLFPEASDLARMNACALALSNDHGGHIANINSDLFPSLPLGLCVKLDEIIGGAQ